MTIDIPQQVREEWKKGLKAKVKGDKEEAMKHFLVYYDLLTIFQQSFNTQFSKEKLKQRKIEVEREIRVLLYDDDYLQKTIIPKEGIAEIKTNLGIEEEQVYIEFKLCKIVSQPIFVARPVKKALEIEQLALVEYRKRKISTERVLKIRLTCEGETMEFPYEEKNEPQIPLSTIAQQIRDSNGMDFTQFTDPQSLYIVQTAYPSIKNLLTIFLVEGGLLTSEEAAMIEVVGYPSKDSNFPEVLGIRE